MASLKSATATRFAQMGLPLIPVLKNSKHPSQAGWTDKGVTDHEIIRAWFDTDPDMNYGVLTGHGHVVLDIDIKNGKDGFASLATLMNGQNLPETLTVRTPSGGFHYYFTSEETLAGTRPAPGIDFQGLGQYVLGPGSSIDSKPYEIVLDVPIQPIPLVLIEALRAAKPKQSTATPAEPQTNWREQPLSTLESEHIQRYLAAIDPNLPYDEWLTTLYVVFNLWGRNEETIALTQSWSSQGDTYQDSEFWKKVTSYDPLHLKKVGLPTLRRTALAYPKAIADLPYAECAVGIAKETYEETINLLTKWGNTVSEPHLDSLRIICEAMAHGAYSHDQTFRDAMPLETGMGKTTAVLALAKVLQGTDRSLLIAGERIEQLEELRQNMLMEGVSPACVGIYHKSAAKYQDIPTVALENVGSIQFLLVTHSKVKADSVRNLADRLNHYQGRERDLVIWDESLLASNGYSVSLEDAIIAAKDWRAIFETKNKKPLGMSKLVEYMTFDLYLEHLITCLECPQDTMALPTPPIHTEVTKKMIKTITTHESYRQVLENLVEFSQRGEARVVKVGGREGLIQFIQTVDESIGRMVILDASAKIRDLVHYDPSVRVIHLSASKDYADVTIHWCDVLSSKDSFGRDKNYVTDYLLEIERIIGKDVPQGQRVLIFTHKEIKSGDNFKDMVRHRLQEKFPFHHFLVLHWGEHRASNKYADVQYVFTVGVQYRREQELAASIIGQTGRLDYPLIDLEVRAVQVSEQADLLYQGFSRGHCRRTYHGKAGKQQIYLFHPKKDAEPVLALLGELMPKVKIKPFQGVHLKRDLHGNAKGYRELAEKLVEHLANLGSDTVSVPVKSLRNEVAPEISSNTSLWKSAIKHAEGELVGWRKERQTFFRCLVSI